MLDKCTLQLEDRISNMQFFFNFCDQAIILLVTELENQKLEVFREITQLSLQNNVAKWRDHFRTNGTQCLTVLINRKRIYRTYV